MQIKYGRENDYADFSHKQNQTADGRAIVQFIEVWSGMMECAAEQSGADVSETACLTVQTAADAAGISRDEDVLAGAAKLLDCWAYGDQLREWVMYHPPEILSEHPDVASSLTASCKTPGRGNKWTDDELAILKEFCPKVGAAGVHKLLPHRSVNACENMALKLGVSARKIKWTDAEIEILRENYPKLGKAVAELLPDRTAMTCQAKACALGLVVEGHFWTDEEGGSS